MNKILFLVQGEGRGHMTQAIALAQMLPGTTIRVLVGRSPERQIPAFFRRAFPDAEAFDSLNFTFDARHRSVNQLRTGLAAAVQIPRYWRTIRRLRAQIRAFAPDIIINFFEPIGSLACRGLGIPAVAIGHQFLFLHPATPFPPRSGLQRRGFRAYLRFFFGHCERKLALSAYAAPPHRDVVVVPPLLRTEVFMRPTRRRGYVLAYLVNRGYASDIGGWDRPTICFWDNPDGPRRVREGKVRFHQIDDRAYLRFMAQCGTLVTTAGFESMCEAAYLGKPMVLVPVEGHFEQLCNATDAAHHGIATHATSFTGIDLSAIRPPQVDRDWLASAARIIPPLLAGLVARACGAPGANRKSEERAFHSFGGVS
ncbi:MAG: glycosyltransferase [Opitutaceae bacterium]|nr:glycosyltransferase [Opitutaceae bacterium]